MRKISNHLDNPIDNILINIANFLNPIFYKTGHTPNIITTYSFIFGLLSIKSYWNGDLKMFVIYYVLGYFFDCADGHFARTYNMTSKFGDLYDHFTDILIPLGLFGVIVYKYVNFKKFGTTQILGVIVILVSMFLMNKHLGCQQKIYKKQKLNNSEFLDNLIPLCKNDDDIQITKFFGTGTFNLVLLLVIGLNII